MRARLDMDKIAKALGGERRSERWARRLRRWLSLLLQVAFLGLLVLAAADPLPLRPETLARLEALAAKIRKQGGDVHPMQLAALLLENATQNLSDEDVLGLVHDDR